MCDRWKHRLVLRTMDSCLCNDKYTGADLRLRSGCGTCKSHLCRDLGLRSKRDEISLTLKFAGEQITDFKNVDVRIKVRTPLRPSGGVYFFTSNHQVTNNHNASLTVEACVIFDAHSEVGDRYFLLKVAKTLGT